MYIAILEPVSTREDWTIPVEVTEPDSNDPIDITGASITLGVRHIKTKAQVLSATVGSGITITNGALGLFQWSFDNSTMGGVTPGTYEVGLIITIGSVTTQLLIGTVPILDGVVT